MRRANVYVAADKKQLVFTGCSMPDLIAGKWSALSVRPHQGWTRVIFWPSTRPDPERHGSVPIYKGLCDVYRYTMVIKQYETTNMINEMLFYAKYHTSFKLQVRQTFILVVSLYSQHLICILTALASATDRPSAMSWSYIFKTNFGIFGMTRDPTRYAKTA